MKTNGYALSVNSGTSSTLTFDANGNMTSDGTNSYSWDAANRLIQIQYPGSGNNSQFSYDGKSQNVSIVETASGSVTSTKQFVWSGNKRRESRGGSGTLISQFFTRGQINGSTKYFYDLDHAGSVREMADNTGSIQAQYSFGHYGEVTKISQIVASDFGYSRYYVHSPSSLNLTRTRAYKSTFGRFLNRDSLGERGGINLFAYVGNRPTNFVDPSGRDPMSTLLGALQKICNDPDCGVKDVGKCLTDAQHLADAFNNFVDHYSNPENAGVAQGNQATNGYMCWDWANGLNLTGNSVPQNSFEIGFTGFMGGPSGAGVHFGVPIVPPGGHDCPKCTVNLDDAFGNTHLGSGFGTGNVHVGSDWGAGGFTTYPGWDPTDSGGMQDMHPDPDGLV